MATRHNPSTSNDAYKSVTIEMLNSHHSKILRALKELGSGTYEQIANHLQWDDRNRAARRLSELERMELVWKPGAKKPTKSGRMAFVYCLTNQPTTDQQAKPISLPEVAKEHIKDEKTVIQKELF